MAAGDPLIDLSDFVNLITGGNSGTPETIWAWKDARQAGAAAQATVAGRLTSLWQYDGSPSGGSNTAPTTSVALTNTSTAGGIAQTSPGGGRTKRLAGAAIAGCLSAGTLIVYDRLNHHGGFSGTTITAQTTGLPTAALTRYTSGVGVQIWLEIYAAIGTTATTVTASYTDQGGNTSQTTLATAFGGTGNSEKNRVIRLPLATNDYGCQAVASVTVLASTLTAGNFGVVLTRPILTVPLPNVGVGKVQSQIEDPSGPIAIGSDAHIAFAWLANGTVSPQIGPMGFFFFEK